MYGQRGERERERMIDRDAKRHDYNTLRKKVDWFRWTVASTNYLLKDALPPPPQLSNLNLKGTRCSTLA